MQEFRTIRRPTTYSSGQIRVVVNLEPFSIHEDLFLSCTTKENDRRKSSHVIKTFPLCKKQIPPRWPVEQGYGTFGTPKIGSTLL